MSRPWMGLNARVSSTELNPLESPDTSNTCHYLGKHGQLGARRGVSQTAKPVMDLKLGRPFLFKGPWGTYTIVPTLTGQVKLYSGSDSTASFSPQNTFTTPLTVDNPSGTGTGSTTEGTVKDAALYLLMKANANFRHDTGASSTFEFGVLVDGGAQYVGGLTITCGGPVTFTTGGDTAGGLALIISNPMLGDTAGAAARVVGDCKITVKAI